MIAMAASSFSPPEPISICNSMGCRSIWNYGTAQRQRRTRCSSRARTRLEPSSLQLESRSTLGLQQ